jgi:hypothetical protein
VGLGECLSFARSVATKSAKVRIDVGGSQVLWELVHVVAHLVIRSDSLDTFRQDIRHWALG